MVRTLTTPTTFVRFEEPQMTRDELLKQRNDLMKIVETERAENKKYGVKHLSYNIRLILDKVWNIDEQIMNLT
jgi:hypothetical protein